MKPVSLRPLDMPTVRHLLKIGGRKPKPSKLRGFNPFEKPIGGPPFGWGGPIRY